MSRQTLLVMAIASVIGLSGCGKEEEPKTQAAAPAPVASAPGAQAPAAPEPGAIDKALNVAREATKGAAESVGEAAAKAKEAAGAAVERGKEMTAGAVERGKELGAAALERGKELSSVAVEGAKGLGAATGDKAQELIQQTKDSMAENRPDLAQGLLDRLGQAKASLPEGVRAEIDRLQSMLGGGPQGQAPGTEEGTPRVWAPPPERMPGVASESVPPAPGAR